MSASQPVLRLVGLEKQHMKSVVISLAASSLFAALATAQPPRYKVTDLGEGLPGGWASQASWINDSGLVTGIATAPDGTQHALLWRGGQLIGKPQPGEPNSAAFAANERGQVSAQAELSATDPKAKDPDNENFCAYGDGLKCLPFLLQNGALHQLPLLGGNNGTVGTINNRGEVAGIAENGHRDPECRSGQAVNFTGPQVRDFEAVIWGPGPGEVRELHPLPGDSVGMAFAINDNGHAVGVSGRCGNTMPPPIAGGPHAVLWEKDGSVHDLGNLGGTGDPAILGVGNVAFAINNQGQVAGVSALQDNKSFRAFLWSKRTGRMQSLGTLPGDVNSGGLAMNDRGDVVGASIDGPLATGNSRVFLWRDGKMYDLNTLMTPDSPFLALLVPGAINSEGSIVGFGLTSTFEIHAFLATPQTSAAESERTESASHSMTRPLLLPGHAHELPGVRFGIAKW